MGRLILGPVAGGLSADGVNLWGRADGPGTLHAWIGQQPDLSDARLGAASLPLDKENGFAGVAPVRELAPNTRYYYALTLDASPPAPRSKAFASFTTNPPDGERAPFAFAFGSCFRPENERWRADLQRHRGAPPGRRFTVHPADRRPNLRRCLSITTISARYAAPWKNTARCTPIPGRGRRSGACWRTCRPS